VKPSARYRGRPRSNRTIEPWACSFPKAADPDRLAVVLARAEALAKGRDRAADDAALAAMGIDPTDWSVEAVRALRAEWLRVAKP